ncbi:MAG TPA: RluA family pseudouridine synthase [Candidatus Polarisedimenticolaceae bacterium]|nr:RluA family pseudouridine synthase [Candidatus Polarisedimenticolaceae bacterium]
MSEPRTVFGVGERDRGKRLDHFLHERIPGLSRSRIQRAIDERVTLSWAVRPRAATPVRPGGEVRIATVPIVEEVRDVPLPILAEGSGWLAVNKPAGIVVHPVNTIRENSLIRMLRRQTGRESLRLVHRLDRETSGVLLVAEDARAASVLATAFERGRVAKEYLAIVEGVVADEEGTIDLAIADGDRSRVFVRREARAGGERAITRWRVERRLLGATLLRVFPETGRRHQIRVHLATIGHPVAGDILYGRPDADYLALVAGGRDARRDEGGPARQLLHCARIAFPSGDVSAPIPEDFTAALEGR